MSKLPVYKLTIDESDPNLGVDFVALVDDPAIKRNWVAFNSATAFKVQSEEKRVISGPLMVADQLIYRVDKTGYEYNVVFDADTIYQIVQKFYKQQRNQDVNLNHKDNEKVDGVYMFESFIIDSKRGIDTPKGFEKLADGSWFGSYKIDNDDVWEEIKSGAFKGFSVQGFFDQSIELNAHQRQEAEAANEIIAMLKAAGMDIILPTS